MTLEHIVIGLIVVAVVGIGLRSVWRTWSGRDSGGCPGCAGCRKRNHDTCDTGGTK